VALPGCQQNLLQCGWGWFKVCEVQPVTFCFYFKLEACRRGAGGAEFSAFRRVIRKLDSRNIQVDAFIELCADEVVELDLQRRLLSWTQKKYDCCSACLNLELTPQTDNSVFRNTRLIILEVNSLLLILSARCKYQARVLRIDKMVSVQAMCSRRSFSVLFHSSLNFYFNQLYLMNPTTP
jgi:hypothetical protein